MKRLLSLSLALLALASTAFAQEFRAPVSKKRPKPQRAPAITERDVQGVIPRAMRGGNPLQMFNPKAPAQYGTGEQSVVYNPYTNKFEGIKLFEIFF